MISMWRSGWELALLLLPLLLRITSTVPVAGSSEPKHTRLILARTLGLLMLPAPLEIGLARTAAVCRIGNLASNNSW